MPDITMCKTDICPKKKTCYRFITTPDPHYQSYAMFTEVCMKDNEYINYIRAEADEVWEGRKR